MGLIFSTLKQEMRKMFKKTHNLFLQWSSLGILGCNVPKIAQFSELYINAHWGSHLIETPGNKVT